MPLQSFNRHPQSVYSYPYLSSNIHRSTQNNSTSAAGSTPNSQTSTDPFDTFRMLGQAGIDSNHLSAAHIASFLGPNPHSQGASVQSPLRSLGLPHIDDTAQSPRSHGQQNRRARALQIRQQIEGTSTGLANAAMPAQQTGMQGNPTPSFLPATQFQQTMRQEHHRQLQIIQNTSQRLHQQMHQVLQAPQQPTGSLVHDPSSARGQATLSDPGLDSTQRFRPLSPTVHPQSTFHAMQTPSTPTPGPLPPLNAVRHGPPFSGGPLPVFATSDMELHPVVEDPTQEYYVVILRWFSRTVA